MSLLQHVLSGSATAFGPSGNYRSAIAKKPIEGQVKVTRTGIVGDEHGNTLRHGGAEQALHQYAFEHYAAWRAEKPEMAALFSAPGAFGENFSSTGMTEDNVCVGDTYRCGTVLLQVSRTRHPCWRLNIRFGDPRMAWRVQESGRLGWHYRVIEEGTLSAGDRLILVHRPHPGWTISRLARALFHAPLDYASLEEMAQLPELSKLSKDYAVRRLSDRKLEDWTERMQTPADA